MWVCVEIFPDGNAFKEKHYADGLIKLVNDNQSIRRKYTECIKKFRNASYCIDWSAAQKTLKVLKIY